MVRDLKPGNLSAGVFNEADVDKAIAECNFSKALGPDEFDGNCIKKDEKTKVEIQKFVLNSLNKNKIPDYLKEAKLILLSKSSSPETTVDNTRPVMVLSHLTKIIEKCIKNKLEEMGSKMLETGSYQSGFKQGMSTQKNLATLLNMTTLSRRKRTMRKIYLSFDLTKAYDSVSRNQLFNILDMRAKTKEEKHIVEIIANLYHN